MSLMKIRLPKRSLVLGSLLALITLTGVALIGLKHNKSDGLSGPAGGAGKAASKLQQRPEKPSPVAAAGLPESDKNHQELARLKRQQLELEKKLKLLEGNVKEIQSDSALHRLGDDTEMPLDEETLRKNREAEEERERAETQAQLDILNDAVDREAPDPQWSAEAAQAIEDRINQYKDLKVSLVNVQCANTLCRLDVIVPQNQGDGAVHHHFPELIPWGGEGFFYIENPETNEVKMYVARENHSLPRISGPSY